MRFLKNLSIILLLAQSLNTQAQKIDTMIVEIDEIIVQENRIRIPISNKAASIGIIRRKSIKYQPVSELSGLLHYQAGVDIRSRGVNGIQNDVSIRGSSFDQVLLLVNGIQINDPQTGHHTLNLPIELEAIDHIEVYKGSSARIFGQNAFAGAINIVTNIPDNNSLKLNLRAGDFETFGGDASITFGSVDFRNSIHMSHNRSEGYKYNTDYHITNIMYQSEILTGIGFIDIFGGVSSRSFGANGFYASPDYRDQFESINTSMVSLSFSPDISTNMDMVIRSYWRKNSDEYLFIRSDPDYYRNVHTTNTGGFDINISAASRLGITGLGVDINRAWINSNRLGDRFRTSATVFIDHQFLLANNKLTITPGLQTVFFSDFASKILPGVDFGYKLGSKMLLFVNSGYTYRIPTYTDLYYEDPANSSNPNLQPEFAFSNEFGIKSRRVKGISVQASYFKRLGVNIIDRVKEDIADKWTPYNLNRVVYSGIDLGADLRLDEIDGTENSILKLINLSYCRTNASVISDLPEYSRWKFENLKDQVSMSITLEYFEGFSHTFNYRYYNRVNMDNYSLFDTRINWQKARLNIFFDLSNITNTEYKETNLVSMPGRWFTVGFGWEVTRVN